MDSNKRTLAIRFHVEDGFRKKRTRFVRCDECGTTETPQSRKGPDGATLCNACGMRYRHFARRVRRRMSFEFILCDQ